jgi:WD40 repeat protein
LTVRATGDVADLAFSHDGSMLAAVGGSKRLDVWNVDSGRPVFAQPPYFTGVGTSVEWLPDGQTVAYAGTDGRAVLFDLAHTVVRGLPLPVFRDNGGGAVFIAPIQGNRLALFPG